MTRRWLAAIAAGLLVAFGAGFGLARLTDASGPAPAGAGAVVAADSPWNLFGRPRAADAPRAGPARPDGFAVWKTRLDTTGPQPLACIQMTRPLDPARAYADFVLVSPELGHPPAVSVRGDSLCLGGFGFSERRVTLLRGLPDKDGDTLAASADVSFAPGDGAPYVGFAGQGVILPRDESDGVGIETVNVSRLSVEVWRVVDRNLVRKQIGATDPTGEGGYPDDYGDNSPDDAGRVVWKGQIAVRGDPANRATTVFPLGAVLKSMTPGAYVIKARDASGGRGEESQSEGDGDEDSGPRPAQASRWVMFTDLALTAYKGAAGLDVVVRSLRTARVARGLKVSLMATDGEPLASGRTDTSGRVAFDAPLLAGQAGSAPKMVMAYGPAGDLAVLDLSRAPVDLSKLGIGGRGADGAPADALGGRAAATAIDGYLYSDRGVYRPGERVHLGALVRDREARAVNDRRGYILVKRPSGVEYRRYAFGDTAGGGVFADIDLPASAPRGRWTAELRIDGLDAPAGALAFSVEDFAPQRLAVTTAGRPEAPVVAGEARAVDVQARFLYGAIGSGLRLQGEARLKADPDPFPAYAGYLWGDDGAPFPEKFVDLGGSVTDGQGKARLVLASAAAGDASAPVSAAVTASVFEPGGRPVREGLTLKLRPRPYYLGIKADPEQASSDRDPLMGLSVIALDASGRPVALNTVSWRLITINTTYDWFQQDGRWQWRRSSREALAARGELTLSGFGPAVLSRRLGWGEYRLEVEGPGGGRAVRRFWSGFGGAGEDAEAPDQARVTVASAPHRQGDTIEIAIKAPYAGQAQVAVATDRLIDFRTLSLPAGGGVVRLKTTAAWGGGAYVLVTVIQPRDPVASPVPRRALGLVWAPLDPGPRRLTVELGTPAKLDSHAPVEVPVRVRGLAAGQRAFVTVAAVDEGILALTKFETPDPAKWYFGKRALGVDYRDDYGRILDANLGAPANVTFGGDELGGQGLTVTPTRTVALWSGVVRTGLDGRARVRLPAGDFNGELRVMAVAWSDRAVGSVSAPLTVREPVIAELDLPRFVAPGDRPMATLELHNIEGRAGAYAARTFADGGLSAAFSETVPLAVGQRIAAHIPFSAPGRAGISQVSLQVAGPGFATRKQYPIQTRLGWGPITRVTTALQPAGTAYTPTQDLLAGLAAGTVDLQVGYSPFQGFDPSAVALSLARYPFSCTEQLTSTAYGKLFAVQASGDPRARAALGEAVGRLIDRQSADGAFGLWRVGDSDADPWLGAFVVDFLLDARARGAPVPDEVMDKALQAMRQISRPDGFASVGYRMRYPDGWVGGERVAAKAATDRLRSRAAAYALYVMAKAGRGDLPRLRWAHDVGMATERSPVAMAQIGAGLMAMGDQARGRDSLRQAIAALGFKDPADDYQSPLRDLAAVIALAYEAGAPDLARPLQQRLAGAVRDPDRLNTQEEAWLLRAAQAMFAASGPPRIAASGVTHVADAGAAAARWAVGDLARARFVNQGGAIWRTVTVRGVPVAPPPVAADGLSVTKSVVSLTGAPVDLATVRQGERVIVRLAGVSHQGRTVRMVVDDALPAGFEIETLLTPEDGAEARHAGAYRFLGSLSTAGAQESRDDRFVAAVTVPGNKAFVLAYVARAVTPGAFYLPGVQVADMYHPAIAARSAAGRLTVVPAE